MYPAGNNHMKEENYTSAMDCYTKAIDLDQRNAVYYCNRCSECFSVLCEGSFAPCYLSNTGTRSSIDSAGYAVGHSTGRGER